ncbi:MAG: cyclic nucleotide-binding protein [Alphaproteobacteria bacterium]|nr:MAG: cyclic nucleotide-binding protein [Alphaproteobacteria bacterium]
MTLDRDIALLSRVNLFQGFTPEQLRLIAFGTERERLPAGALLYREGETADGGYVVAHGQIDLVLPRGRREMVLESCGEGSLVGEMALIAANRRSTDALARLDSEVLYVPRTLFHRMLREYPETAAFLHGRIAQAVRRLVKQIDEVNRRLDAVKPLMAGAGKPDDEPAKD